jgi:DNA transformation protein
MGRNSDDLRGAKNIGPKIHERLVGVGIRSMSDLRKVGAPAAYKRIVRKYRNEPIPRCYYLYSLYGAMNNISWKSLSQAMKERLVKESGRS